MPSLMLEETRGAPGCVARQLLFDRERYLALGQRLREAPPEAIATIGRGSSAHAAQYLAFLLMRRMGRLVAPLPMSLLTLYGAPPRAPGLLLLAISQSGESPDLLATVRELRAAGANTAAWVNAPGSPLAAASAWPFALHAAPEQCVVATRSCLASLVGAARLAAAWQGDARLGDAIQALPTALREAAAADGPGGLLPLVPAGRMLVVGRGAGLAVAAEVALKLKETCGIQAEAFSAAEVQHGPMALVTADYPVLVLALRGPAQPGLLELARAWRARGARVLLAAPPGVAGRDLTLVETLDEDLDPIAALQGLYVHLEALARARGLDPDAPPNLAKVTRTR